MGLAAIAGVVASSTFFNVAEATSLSWAARAAMPTPRFELGVAASLNGSVYAAGGRTQGPILDAFERYNPATDTWTALAPMPTARHGLGLVEGPNGKLYAIGGYGNDYLATVEEYNPTTNTWGARASMPAARYGLSIALGPNGKIYAMGGRDSSVGASDSVFEYDISGNSWATVASMPGTSIHGGAARAANGKIYMVRGTNFSSFVPELYEYDTATNAWATRSAVPVLRGLLGVTASPNGSIFAVGGQNSSSILADVEEYDPATDTWLSQTPMPTSRSRLGAAVATNGRLYAIGGVTDFSTADTVGTVEEGSQAIADFQLALEVAPSALPADGRSESSLTATVTSPTGEPVSGHLVVFSIVSGGGLVPAPVATTAANGVAAVDYIAGIDPGTARVAAEFAPPSGLLRAERDIALTATLPDLAVFVLDITFHDPSTGAELFPGDSSPLPPNVTMEMRANVRNVGSLPSPAGIEVQFKDSLVEFAPPGIIGPTLLSTVVLPAVPTGASAVVSVQHAFADEGFHLARVVVDPSGALVEQTTDNNVAAQGFWIGQVPPNPGDIIATEVDLESPDGLSAGGLPAARVGGTLRVFGRADYEPFLPFDPDNSLGIAAVKGGIVRLSLFDSEGTEVSLVIGGQTIMPVQGDAGQLRALHTIGTVGGADKSPVGRYPNRSAVDRWVILVPPAPGNYTLEACVSDTGFMRCASHEFVVVANGPDLVATQLALPDDGAGAELPPALGLPTSMSASVLNTGDATVEDVKVIFLVDGAPTGLEVILPEVDPGAQVPVAFPWIPDCGTGSVSVVIDPDDSIAEVNEANNVATRQLPDLVVTDVRVRPSGGAQSEVVFDVSNLGGMPVGTYDAKISVTPPSGPVVEDTVGVGGTGTFLALSSFVFDQAGSYTFEVKVDTPIDLPAGLCGDVPEQDEDNNDHDRTIGVFQWAGGAGSWTDAAKWDDSGGLPGTGYPGSAGGHGALIDLAGSHVTLASLPAGFQPLDLLVMDRGAQLTLGGPSSAPFTLAADEIVVAASTGPTRILVDDDDSAATGIEIHADRVTVAAGASISADARGFPGGGVNANGQGPGAGSRVVAGCVTGRRGGGGGYGGNGASSGSNGIGGGVYGSLLVPTDLGSGGAGGSCGAENGGRGGGRVRLIVSDTLNVDGVVSANGGAALTARSGGGSGGSVFVTAGQISGSGLIRANGGAGDTTSDPGGAGGGGRVALEFGDTTFNGTTEAYGGGGAVKGGAGTIYLSKTSAPTDTTLKVINEGSVGALTNIPDGPYSFNNLVVDGRARLWLSGGDSFDVTGGTITHPSGSTLTIDSGSLTIDGTSYTLGGSLDVTPAGGSFTSSSTANGSSLVVESGGVFEAGASPVVLGDITVESGGTIRPTSFQIPVELRAATLSVDAGGMVHANALGFAGGATNVNGQGPGAGARVVGGCVTGRRGGGGGYGGNGASSGSNGIGGGVYGSLLVPTDLGSGGAGGGCSGENGGRGGGAIRIIVDGTLGIDGVVSANGGAALTARSGGGSGGSVFVTAGQITGNGLIRANGGAGDITSDPGGAGGGGRVALEFGSTTFNGTTEAFGGGGAVKGGAGTIYLSKTSAPTETTLKVINAGSVGALTNIPDGPYSFNNLVVDSGAHLRLSGGDSFDVTGGTITHPSGSTLTIDSGSLSIDGTSYTLGGFLEVTAAAGGSFTSSSTANGSSLVIESGGVFEAGATPVVLGSITVESGGTIRPTSFQIPVELRAATLSVDAGGMVHANALGFAGGGVNANGQGPGAGARVVGGCVTGRRGGGGGYGGNGASSGSNGIGGGVYGSLLAPTDLGSGGAGGGCGGENGGRGGGAIVIVVDGTLGIDGVVSANGGAATTARSGGGSGGSVFVTAGQITGTGLIRANGGTGDITSDPGGAGGGGRVALEFGSTTFNGTTEAFGGGGAVKGGAGTIYLRDTAQAFGALLVVNANVGAITDLVDDGYTVTNLTLDGGARLVLSAADSLTVTEDSAHSANSTLFTSGQLTLDGSLVYSLLGTLRINAGGHLTGVNGSELEVLAGGLLETDDDVAVLDTLSVASGGTVRPRSGASSVLLDADTVIRLPAA